MSAMEIIFLILRDRMRKLVDYYSVVSKRTVMISNPTTDDKLFLFAWLQIKDFFQFTIYDLNRMLHLTSR